MENKKFIKTFSSDVTIAKKVITELMVFLSDGFPNLSVEDSYDLKLIFSELLFNAIIHGNSEDMSKCVTLCVEIMPSNVIFSTIQDEGSGFDYSKLLAKSSSPTTDYDMFSENGRGIKLVSSLTDILSFNSTGNQIKFYKRVNI